MPELKDILTGIREKHGNKSEVAKMLGIKSQLLGQYEKGSRNPKLGFYKKWKEVFNEDLESMLDEPNVSHETKNGTSIHKPSDNKQLSMGVKETFYRDLIENNEEYSLLPRAVLKDYKIVPDKIINVIIQSNENERKAIEKSMTLEIESLNKKYELIIEGYENKIQRLESEKEKLMRENERLMSQIPAQNQ